MKMYVLISGLLYLAKSQKHKISEKLSLKIKNFENIKVTSFYSLTNSKKLNSAEQTTH